MTGLTISQLLERAEKGLESANALLKQDRQDEGLYELLEAVDQIREALWLLAAKGPEPEGPSGKSESPQQ